MTNIVYFNFPAHGHINPSLPIVQELVRRGEKVDYYCFEEYRDKIEFAGARFIPLPTSPWDTDKLDCLSFPLIGCYLLQTSLDVLPVLSEKLRHNPPELIVFDNMCPWGKILGRLLQRPAVAIYTSVVLQPTFFPPVWRLLAANGIGLIPKNLQLYCKYRQLAARLAQHYQVDRIGLRALACQRGDLNIVLTSEAFQEDMTLFDETYIFAGPCIADRRPDPDFPLAEIAGKSVIYISLGTVFHNIPFYKKCLQAFANSDRIVVMSVGKSTDIRSLGDIPPNFIVRNQVPQLEILKHTSVFITHAGMNSTMEGLINGIPLVVVPQGSDQYWTAKRVEDLGVGIWIKEKNFQPSQLQEVVEKVTNNAEIRQNVKRLGASLLAAGGAQKAADKLLEVKKRGWA